MMRITFNGEQVNFAINHRIPQKYWNAKLSKSSKGYEGSKELNRFLQDLQFRAFDAFTTLEREEDDFTAKRIHDVMNGIGVESSRYILDLWKEQVQDVKSRVGKNIAHTTYKKYITSQRLFTSFLLNTYNIRDLRISNLKKHHIESYYTYLIRERSKSSA
jgi:hypothetical protein